MSQSTDYQDCICPGVGGGGESTIVGALSFYPSSFSQTGFFFSFSFSSIMFGKREKIMMRRCSLFSTHPRKEMIKCWIVSLEIVISKLCISGALVEEAAGCEKFLVCLGLKQPRRVRGEFRNSVVFVCTNL